MSNKGTRADSSATGDSVAETPNTAARPKTIIICESDFSDTEELHEYLARRLKFPKHYGKNFAALSDCLGDVSSPLIIRIERAEIGRRHNWFGRACKVISRSAEENPHLCYEEKQGDSDR